jgi:uncharacterized membrane protein
MEGFLIAIVVIAAIVLPIVALTKISAVDSRLWKIEKGLKEIIMALNEIENPAPQVYSPAPPALPAQPVPTTPPAAFAVTEPEPATEPKTEAVPLAALEPCVAISAEPVPKPKPVTAVVPKEPVKEPAPVPVQQPAQKPAQKPIEKPAEKPAEASKTPYRFENLLGKAGIVTLVLGVAFFVKYAIDKDWINEAGRVVIGLLTGGVLIGIAHKIREKYDVLSALMVGGGISVFYITITLAFREYHIFNHTVAFAILIAITAGSVALSLIYNRKELALFSLLGGYASPLMISTGDGNYVVLFSFLFILNSGMLIISMRKKWRVIGLVSFVCTWLFYWAWLLINFNDEYAGALTFGILFFAQFYLLALFDHFSSNRAISPFQVGVILANNLLMLSSAIYIFNDTELNLRGLISICMAIVNAIVMMALLRRGNVDKRLTYFLIAVVVSFVSLAIPMQLDGHVITMFWSAEMVILLWLWKRTDIRIFHLGFLLISGLTLISYVWDVTAIYFDSGELPVVFNRAFITGSIVAAAFVVSRFMLPRESKLWNIFTAIGWGVAYVVPFAEICYQFGAGPMAVRGYFTAMALAVYTTIYAAVLSVYLKKHLSKTADYLAYLMSVVGLYVIAVMPLITAVRWEVFHSISKNTSLLLVHFLSLPAVAWLVREALKSRAGVSKQVFTPLGWMLAICVVAILSVEMDNIAAQLTATAENYNEVMSNVHTLGYPIMWGVLAMGLMIWGLKAKEVLPRQISLAFFAVIVLKFYAADIWRMSQSGRIVSFIILGVILLLSSFLIQKIKVLIKADDPGSGPDQR